MSNPAWPAYPFPQSPQLKDFGEQLEPNLLVTQMESGRAHMRLRDTLIQHVFNMSLVLTEDQKNEFQAFYKTSCKAGAQPFDWVHPTTGAATTFRFRSMGEFKPYTTNLFTVKFQVEVYS